MSYTEDHNNFVFYIYLFLQISEARFTKWF